MNTKQPRYRNSSRRNLPALLAFAALAACTAPALLAQTNDIKPKDAKTSTGSTDTKPAFVPQKTEAKSNDAKTDNSVIELTPFEVNSTKDTGYAATSTLAGSRLNTNLRDVASAISVITPEFMQDTASTDLQNMLVYQTNAEVSGIGGNYYGRDANDYGYREEMLVNPDKGTRIRGLNSADLTRDYFPTNIPLDAYNTSRVDIQRGPNSILFGLGSPAGIINNTLKTPNMQKLAIHTEFRVASYGSTREVLDVDLPLIKDTLGLRIVGLNDLSHYRQDFTFNHDKRLYGAMRWKPKLAPGVYTQIDAKFESGRISANRPVAVTAADFISNWFGPLNHYLMYNPLTNNGKPQDPTGASHPELSHYFAGAPARDWWNDSPGTIFQDPTMSTIGNGHVDAYRQRDGVPWGGLSGVTNPNYDEGGTGAWNKDTAAYYANNPIVSQIIKQYENKTGNTFSGFGSSLWPTQMILSGPLAFINRTMQGPNKHEWNNFDTANFEVTQTYLNGHLGFNGAYNRENYRSGYTNAISTDRVTVDVNTVLRDGSANPDVGRPVIIGPSSGQFSSNKRENYRGTGYVKIIPSDYFGEDSFLSKIFGEQTLTGVFSSLHEANFSRNFNLYAWDAQSYGGTFENSPNYKAWWGIHYIGSSLMDVANFSDIPASAIQGVTANQTPAATSNTLLWDNATQSWHTANVTLDNWQTDLSKLYTGAAESYNNTKSKAFVWQGHFLNNSIIPLFGWRRDVYEDWNKPPSSGFNDKTNGFAQPYDPAWSYTGTTPLKSDVQNRSWGVVLHANQLLGLFHQEMPAGLDVSLFYNKSNTFQPSGVGRDVYGNTLPPPSGQTRDRGVLITALHNKLSVRMTWYTTIQKNTSMSDPSGMVYWAKAGVVRTMNAMAMEAWGPTARTKDQTTPEFLVNKWFFGDNYDKTIANTPLPADWQSQLSTLVNQPLRIRHAAVPGDPTYVAEGTINPATGSPYLAPFLSDAEMAYRQAWFAARTNAQWFRPLDPTWVAAEQFKKITGDDYRIWGESPPAGQILTNDLESKGFELELTANPTPNWRLTFNASRNTAVRSNILPDWAAFIANSKSLWFDGYQKIPVSQLNYWNITGFAQIRHWGGDITYSGLADTFGGRMMQNVYGPYQNAISANGQAVNELRKWRWNFVSNYSFDHGFLKNINVGGAVRWQDKAAIGYYPKFNSDAQIWVTDVTRPIYAPSETNYDAWIGYKHKLTDKIMWRIQLNVHNLFAKSDLIPIMANPDGTTAQVRIPAETTYSLTTSFDF